MDQDRQLRRIGRGKLIWALVAAAGTFVAQIVGTVIVILADISIDSPWTTVITAGASAVVAAAAIIALGGGSWLRTKLQDVTHAFRFGWWCLAVSGMLVVFDVWSNMAEGTAINPDWPVLLLRCTLMCLAIGLSEELMFRGLILQGLLAVMGRSRRGILWAVVITSLAFGCAHVTVEDFTGPAQVAQALLKVSQTGIYSLLMCAIVLQSRNLVGASLYHGFDDLLLIAPGYAFFGTSLDIDYVQEGSEAILSIVMYALVVGLYVPLVIKSVRALRQLGETNRGAFMEGVKLAPEAGAAYVPVAPGTAMPVPAQDPWAASQTPYPAAPQATMPASAPQAAVSQAPSPAQAPQAAAPTSYGQAPAQASYPAPSRRPPRPRGL